MISDSYILQFPKIPDHRGNLTHIEGAHHIPFEVKRVYYLYDVPAGETRGGHAHTRLRQVLIALGGSFDAVLDDGSHRRRITLSRPWEGLYIPVMTWRELENFSSGVVCLVLASEHYDEKDYYRNYEEFLKVVRG